MAAKPRKKAIEQSTRSVTVGVRLEPKLRYLAEIASRKQRRSLSSFIEWAVAEALDRVTIESDRESSTTIADVAESLWDVDEAERFVKLALRYSDLLNHEEQILWKLIRDNGALWKGQHDMAGAFVWRVRPESLRIDMLREHWEQFNKVARNKAGKDTLPKWEAKGSPTKPAPVEDFEDDIPF